MRHAVTAFLVGLTLTATAMVVYGVVLHFGLAR